jgi:hypothetical protein
MIAFPQADARYLFLWEDAPSRLAGVGEARPALLR